MGNRRVCSLFDRVEVGDGEVSDWRDLEEFHYRRGRAGAIDRVFVLRYREGDSDGAWSRLRGARARVIGVIVYAMPIPNVALRNVATEKRYTGWTDRRMGLKLLNAEMRCISRVVIEPRFRGIGLGRYLVAETLGRAGVEMVEAMAAMGQVNPFFERAGMRRYEGGVNGKAVRLQAALAEVGLGRGQCLDEKVLLAAVRDLAEDEQRFLDKELERFGKGFRYRRYFEGLEGERLRRELVRWVVKYGFNEPVYYLWKRC